ncbi:MAG: hypothetical protein HOV92_12580 [Streptomyces sp.]|nr:hypothetical protein [Streptomyces sp.]
MTRLPDHQQPTARQAGQPIHPDIARRRAAQIAAAVDDVFAGQPTAVRVEDPTIPSWQDGSRIGTAPPVDQPGRPSMSQRAVDLNTTILSSSVLVAALGGAASAVMWASGLANPTALAWVCVCVVAVPAALAIPVLALKGLMKSAKQVAEAAPPVIHQHYSGAVTQTNTTINADSHGLIAVTRPELPPTR